MVLLFLTPFLVAVVVVVVVVVVVAVGGVVVTAIGTAVAIVTCDGSGLADSMPCGCAVTVMGCGGGFERNEPRSPPLKF